MTTRKRGAPKGNHNALKHGFYSAAFKERERHLLSQVSIGDLVGEIDAIRVASYRFLAALNATSAPLDVDLQLAALRAVNLSAQSINSLLRSQTLLSFVIESDAVASLAAVVPLEAAELPPCLPPAESPITNPE